MLRPILCLVLAPVLVTACAGAPATAPPIPSPSPPAAVAASPAPSTTVLPTVAPTLTPAPKTSAPVRLAEIKLDTQTGTAYTLDWSPDGEQLAAGSGFEITVLDDELKTAPTILKPAGGALGMAWRPDGTQFATINGNRNPTITLWDWDRIKNTLEPSKTLKGLTDQYGIASSPDGKWLASLAGDSKTTIQIWDTATWQEIDRFELPYTTPRRALNWSADSAALYDAGDSAKGTIIFSVSAQDGTVKELATLPTAQVQVFGMSPDAKHFAVADNSGHVLILETALGETVSEFDSVAEPVDLVWNPQNQTLAILGYKTMLELWDVSGLD